MSSRPELQSQPEIFYNDEEAHKYTSSSCIIEIQAQQSERDMELLALPDDGVPRLLIDIAQRLSLVEIMTYPQHKEEVGGFFMERGQILDRFLRWYR
ncbi:unnamed protein product [Ilex paraguariensis]|uniref:Uncharacterized protein n=1 Tax=Ilex paraguariensis TaxID=185542 RepID=A0ABC8RNM9_9AQUA